MSVQAAWWQGQQEQIYYSAATFRRWLDCLARPGKVNRLEWPGFLGEPPQGTSGPVNFFALGAMLTLLDREVGGGVIAGREWLDNSSPVVRWLMLRSDMRPAPPAEADFVLVCDPGAGEILARLNQGTLLEPENSATVVYCVESLSAGQTEVETGAISLKLSGPGIAGTIWLQVAGLEQAELGLIRETRRNYPLGLDLFLVDRDGNCAGLPRTTRFE